MTHVASPSDDDVASPAVKQAITILEGLAGQPAGLTLTELAERLKLAKNAVFRITKTLQGCGYIARDRESLRFRLTGKFLTLGQPQFAGQTLSEAALPAMRRLRDACRETVQLGVRSGIEGVIIEVLDGLFPLRIAVEIGLRFPLHNNAPGKCLLAYLPTLEQRELMPQLTLVASTTRTITDVTRLSEECQAIVQQGYSTDHAEADEGIHCVAAPILDRHRRILATLWVSGPSRRMPPEHFAAIGAQVKHTADSISLELAH